MSEPVGYTRRWQRSIRFKRCDCGRPAHHYFGGWECEICKTIRLNIELWNLHGTDLSGILRGTRAERAA